MEPLIRTEIDRHYSELYDESARLSATCLQPLPTYWTSVEDRVCTRSGYQSSAIARP